MRIKLTDADRKRYSTPEWMDFDLTRPQLSEIRAVGKAGFKGWADLIRHMDSKDMDERFAARGVVYWLAVCRHKEVTWEAFDLDLFGVEMKESTDPNPSAPKGASTS